MYILQTTYDLKISSLPTQEDSFCGSPCLEIIMGQFGIVCIRVLGALAALVALAQAFPVVDVEQTPTFTRFTSTDNPELSLRFVSDSGVCETTPGVHQMSGYIDVGTNMSMVSIGVLRHIPFHDIILISVVLVL